MESSLDELKNALVYVYVLTGLRAQNYPAGEEKEMLHRFVVQHYGGHSADEIKLAFELAITLQLDVDANCYENFSIAYFCRIMEAYRVWTREQLRQLPVPVQPLKIPTAEERRQLDLDYAHFKLSLINKLPFKLNANVE